uniref:Uncharacterized protein n=1 Tax=Lepeophtheirus salmonis TaxID=72036 RepID=A0A0K2SVB2_LEPSM
MRYFFSTALDFDTYNHGHCSWTLAKLSGDCRLCYTSLFNAIKDHLDDPEVNDNFN